MTALTDRTSGPASGTIDKIDFLPVKSVELDNGIPVSLLQAGSQDVTKIDFQFPAGAVQAGVPLLASATANLMLEGTTSKSSRQISETVDFYGAYLHTQTFHHHTVFTLLSLTRHLPALLPLVEDVLRNPSFEQHEFDIFLEKKHEEFLLENQKVRNLAARHFGEILFGPEHPYGRQLKEAHFEQLTPQHIKHFHATGYSPAHCRIYVAGRPGKDILKQLNQRFGTPHLEPALLSNGMIPPPFSSADKFKLVEKPGALQSAIKIGRPLFNNHHPDFISLQVLNTLLGGFFGSRLMSSVREEKGLSYGIGSYIMPLKYSGIWGISCEVACENRAEAIDAIFEEFDKLRLHPIHPHELQMVKNYMMGELLRNFDGPFSTTDIYRALQEFDLDFDFYQKMIKHIQTVTAGQIQQMAQKYLIREEFWVVGAGR